MSERADQDIVNLENEVKGWKEKILPVNKGFIELERDLYFMCRTQRGYEVEYDPSYEEGCSPTETLLLSVGGCLAIDVVMFLRKMKCEITKFKMKLEGTRNLTPPQYYKSIDIKIEIAGDNITPRKLDRAISLSQEKYCSVYHSLRSDLEVNVTYEIL
jgi:uncharacterized OsmC-like protein